MQHHPEVFALSLLNPKTLPLHYLLLSLPSAPVRAAQTRRRSGLGFRVLEFFLLERPVTGVVGYWVMAPLGTMRIVKRLYKGQQPAKRVSGLLGLVGVWQLCLRRGVVLSKCLVARNQAIGFDAPHLEA